MDEESCSQEDTTPEESNEEEEENLNIMSDQSVVVTAPDNSIVQFSGSSTKIPNYKLRDSRYHDFNVIFIVYSLFLYYH